MMALDLGLTPEHPLRWERQQGEGLPERDIESLGVMGWGGGGGRKFFRRRRRRRPPGGAGRGLVGFRWVDSFQMGGLFSDAGDGP